MSLANDSVQDLRHFEGWKGLLYDDATAKPLKQGDTIKGHPTIGCGFALDTAGLQDCEIAFILQNRIAGFIAAASASLPGIWETLCEARQRVIINMLYELGAEGFNEFQHFKSALEAGDFDGAATALLDSLAAKQAPKRWQWNADTMRSGEVQPYD